MKKMMIAAVALTMLGGAAFAQTGSPKVNTPAKKEVKHDSQKHAMHKKAVQDKKAASAAKKTETAK